MLSLPFYKYAHAPRNQLSSAASAYHTPINRPVLHLSRSSSAPRAYVLTDMKKQARRQRIPAFGEWNYHYGYGDDWSVTQYFDSAMYSGGGLLMAAAAPPSPSSKPVKKVVKWSDSATLTLDEDEKQLQRQRKVVVGDHDHGAAVVITRKQGKQSRVADFNKQEACRRVVKPVDQDLYEIPPDMLCHKPSRKRLTRSGRTVWLGCLGLSCIEA